MKSVDFIFMQCMDFPGNYIGTPVSYTIRKYIFYVVLYHLQGGGSRIWKNSENEDKMNESLSYHYWHFVFVYVGESQNFKNPELLKFKS